MATVQDIERVIDEIERKFMSCSVCFEVECNDFVDIKVNKIVMQNVLTNTLRYITGIHFTPKSFDDIRVFIRSFKCRQHLDAIYDHFTKICDSLLNSTNFLGSIIATDDDGALLVLNCNGQAYVYKCKSGAKVDRIVYYPTAVLAIPSYDLYERLNRSTNRVICGKLQGGKDDDYVEIDTVLDELDVAFFSNVMVSLNGTMLPYPEFIECMRQLLL